MVFWYLKQLQYNIQNHIAFYKNGILLFEAKTMQFPKSGCSMKMVFFYLKQLQYNFQNRMQHQNGIFLFETII